MSAADVYECMAFDLTQSGDWMEKYKKQQELAASRALSPEEYTAQFKQLLGGG